MILTLFPVSYADNSGSAQTEVEYISISSESDLFALAANCHLDSYSKNKVVSLTSDIVLTRDFTPIPIFSGTFDGQGHTIKGLNVGGKVTYAGLFGILDKSATVKNLLVSGVVVPEGDISSTGGIAAENNGTIDNCVFTGYVRGSKKTGGIVGVNNGIVSNCNNFAYVNVDIKDGKVSVKDIKSLSISNITAILSIKTINACEDIGGIAGYNNGIIVSCSNNNTVGTADNGYSVGGIAGTNEGYISLCTNVASVHGNSKVGGIIGTGVPFVKKAYSEDLLSGPKKEVDNLLSIVDNFTYDLDADTNNITASINSILSTIASASNHANYLVREVKNVANDKITEVNGIVDFGNSAVTGLKNISSEVSNVGEDLSEGIGNIKSGVDVFTKASDIWEIIDKIPDAIQYIDAGMDSFTDISDDINDATTELEEMMQNLESVGIPSFSTVSDEFTDAVTYLTNDMKTISGQMKGLSNSVNNTEKNVTKNVRSVTAEAKNVSNGLFDVAYSLSDISVSTFLKDVSAESLSSGDNHFGIVESCLNTGSVSGVENIGGIAGITTLSGIPSITDNKDGEGVTIKSLQYRSIISYSRNYGYITGSGSNIGSICGTQKLGAVSNCQGYGYVASTDGSYVGGIVGNCSGLVKSCFSKAPLYGKSYVGGIIGTGNDSSLLSGGASVSSCFSDVSVSGCEQHMGGIAGSDSGTFLYNYFVSNILNGIGTYSMEYSAAPISRESLLAIEGCPQEFTWSDAKLLAAATSTDNTDNSSYGYAVAAISALALALILAIILLITKGSKSKSGAVKNAPASSNPPWKD